MNAGRRKVKDDVEGIVGTGRPYDRIICVTSRFARAKTRAELEDALNGEIRNPNRSPRPNMDHKGDH